MRLWKEKSIKDGHVVLKDGLVEGFADFNPDEDPTDESISWVFPKLIIESEAIQSFVISLKEAMNLELVNSKSRLRDMILDSLPTEVVTNRPFPGVYKITFHIQWLEQMRQALKHDTSSNPKNHGPGGANHLVATGSDGKIQVLEIREYLSQTWPSTGLRILSVLEQMIVQDAKTFREGKFQRYLLAI